MPGEGNNVDAAEGRGGISCDNASVRRDGLTMSDLSFNPVHLRPFHLTALTHFEPRMHRLQKFCKKILFFLRNNFAWLVGAADGAEGRACLRVCLTWKKASFSQCLMDATDAVTGFCVDAVSAWVTPRRESLLVKSTDSARLQLCSTLTLSQTHGI